MSDPSDRAQHAALERYVATIRRPRRIYVATVLTLIISASLIARFVWTSGEIAHTTLSTASSAAPSITLRAPSAHLRRSWTSAERAALGAPYWGGTIIGYTTHRVRGQNATTGATTWSYTRTDRTVCQVMQDQGVTIALYEHSGNCDELTALDSATGQRRWTRTLDENGAPLTGHPTYNVTATTVLIITTRVIYALDPRSGIDRWMYQPTGCAITGAVLGSSGALISQRCSTPPCAGLRFCGPGPQLLLRDPVSPRADDPAHKTNPDQIKWNSVGTTATPLSADRVLLALDHTSNTVEILAESDGRARLSLRLPAFDPDVAVAQLSTGSVELVWINGITYAFGGSHARPTWSRDTAAPPTPADEDGGPITSVVDGNLVLCDPSSGKLGGVFPVDPSVPPGTRGYQYGTGFILAGPNVMVYR